jgi:hypothetical protein
MRNFVDKSTFALKSQTIGIRKNACKNNAYQRVFRVLGKYALVNDIFLVACCTR